MYDTLFTHFKLIRCQIIYEDSDYEDLTKKETLSLRWLHSIPSAKIANCRKHAKKLEAIIKSDREPEVVAANVDSNSNSALKNNSNTTAGSAKRGRTPKAVSIHTVDLTDQSNTESSSPNSKQVNSTGSHENNSSSPLNEGPPTKRRRNSSLIVDIDPQETVCNVY